MEQNAKNCIQGLDQALLMKTKMAELAYSAQNYYRFSICTFCKSCICRKLQDWSFRCGGKKCLFVFFCEMGFFVFFLELQLTMLVLAAIAPYSPLQRERRASAQGGNLQPNRSSLREKH